MKRSRLADLNVRIEISSAIRLLNREHRFPLGSNAFLLIRAPRGLDSSQALW